MVVIFLSFIVGIYLAFDLQMIKASLLYSNKQLNITFYNKSNNSALNHFDLFDLTFLQFIYFGGYYCNFFYFY